MRLVSATIAGLLAVVMLASCGSTAACGAGTAPLGGQCVAILTCGPGTVADGGVCTPALTCDAGSAPVNGQCVPILACGPGTVLDGGVCTADPSAHRYDVRIGASTVPANGYSKIPVTVLATDGTGAPLVGETVSIGVEQPFQGSLTPPAVTLGPLGAQAWFVPCNSALLTGCIGPARLTVASASAPGTVLGRSATFTLLAPQGVGSPAPCQVGGNVVFFDGMPGDYIHPGTDTIRVGAWSASISGGNYLSMFVTPSDSSQGFWWDLTFSSQQLGQPLVAQIYDAAERAPFASPGHPGIDISGDGRGCNTITGRFQVFDLQTSGNTVRSFTATFEQACEGGAALLRGCVHYEQ